jgi:hypothetical protein
MRDDATTAENRTTALLELTPADLQVVSGGVVPARSHTDLCDHGGPLCGGPSLSGVLWSRVNRPEPIKNNEAANRGGLGGSW